MKFLCFFDSPDGMSKTPTWASEVTEERICYRRASASVSPDAGIQSCEPHDVLYGFMAGLFINPSMDDAPHGVVEIAEAVGANVVCRVDAKTVQDGVVPTSYAKSVGLLRRAEGLSIAAFSSHWNEIHVELAMKREHNFFRYVTNVVEDVYGEFPWDGVVEQWFESEEILRAEYASFDFSKQADVVEDTKKMVSEMDHWVAVPLGSRFHS